MERQPERPGCRRGYGTGARAAPLVKRRHCIERALISGWGSGSKRLPHAEHAQRGGDQHNAEQGLDGPAGHESHEQATDERTGDGAAAPAPIPRTRRPSHTYEGPGSLRPSEPLRLGAPPGGGVRVERRPVNILPPPAEGRRVRETTGRIASRLGFACPVRVNPLEIGRPTHRGHPAPLGHGDGRHGDAFSCSSEL